MVQFVNCSLYHMVVRRSPKSTNGDSKNSIHGLTAINPAAALFLICSTLIKLCRIKRKIKGGSEPFLDRINWDA